MLPDCPKMCKFCTMRQKNLFNFKVTLGESQVAKFATQELFAFGVEVSNFIIKETLLLYLRNLHIFKFGESGVLTSLIPRNSLLFCQEDCNCCTKPRADLQCLSVALYSHQRCFCFSFNKNIKYLKQCISLSFIVLSQIKIDY